MQSIRWWYTLALAAAVVPFPSSQAALTDGFLEGVRDLVYDDELQLIFTAAIHGSVAAINVTVPSHPVLVGAISPSSVLDAHGLAYDPVRNRVFVASVSTATITCIDVSVPAMPTVLATVTNQTWLHYSTHLSFDAVRSALFVVSAGDGSDERNASEAAAGHSITSIVVYGACFQAGFCTRGCYWIPRLHAGDQ
jgi:hypothetical protein